jgi:hypothetical protein
VSRHLPGNETGKYILDGHEPVEEPDLMRWAEWMEANDRQIRLTVQGDVWVSTIFLGLDHNWDEGPPLLFETMVFGLTGDEYQERYSTWAEAEQGHANAVNQTFKPTPILALPVKADNDL